MILKTIFLVPRKSFCIVIDISKLNDERFKMKTNKGSSINDVTVLGGKGYQGFCDDSTKALVLKSITMEGEGVSKIIINYVTSFMDGP